MFLVEYRLGVGLFLSLGLSSGTRKRVWFVYPIDDARDCGMVLSFSVGLFRFPCLIVLFCPVSLLIEGIYCWNKVKYLIFGISHLDGKA